MEERKPATPVPDTHPREAKARVLATSHPQVRIAVLVTVAKRRSHANDRQVRNGHTECGVSLPGNVIQPERGRRR